MGKTYVLGIMEDDYMSKITEGEAWWGSRKAGLSSGIAAG